MMANNLPPGPTPGSLREKIEWMLQRPFVLAYENIVEPVGQRLRAGVDNFFEQIETRFVDYNRPLINKMLEAPDLPDFVREPLERVREPGSQVEVAAVVSVVVGLLVGLVAGAMQPIARFMSYFVERIVQTGRPDPASLWRMHWRGALDVSQRDSYLDDLGVSDRLKTAFGTIAEVRPGIAEIVTLWLRQEIDGAEMRDRLQQEGVPSEHIPDIIALSRALPGPGDLVRFALREAWRDDVATKYGYDEDYVAEFGEWMERLGYAEDWAKKYWRAHWELPSVTLGMEMVHRRIITEDEFKDMLRVADIPAGWRDKVSQAIYSPYTRVDARRMHQLGILADADLVDVYMDQGYDLEHAENMALFTIRYNQESERELTKADILNGYRDGLLSFYEARDMLVSINYSIADAAYLLARVDAQQAQKLVDAEIGITKDLYLNGDLTLTEAQAELTALGLPARQMELLIQEWTIDRDGKVKRPSRETLERLYKTGAITQEDFVSTLSAIGYQEKYVDWYLRNIALEREAEAEKEEERARKERERVEKDRRKTDYQRKKAEIDVEIAEVQGAIAAADVAMVEAVHDRNEALRAALPLEERAQIERDYMLVAHDADAAIGEARIAVTDLQAEDKVLRSQLAEIDQSLATNVDVAEQVAIKAAIASMRTQQARFTDAAAILRVEIARLKETAARETDPLVLEQYALDLLALQTREQEERQAITDVGIDIAEATAALGATMALERRSELEAEQASVRIGMADVAERITTAQAAMAETAAAKTAARNAMDVELTELPGAVQELEIRQHYDSLIERIKAQVKELRVRLSQLRVQKALLTFEYRGPVG